MTRSHVFRGALLAAALLAGCGSSSSGSGSNAGGAAATPSDVQAACTALCNHEQACQTGSSSCVTNCFNFSPELVRHDFIVAYTACMNSADCSKNADACVLDAANQVAPAWQQDPARQQCLDRRTACDGSFADDICGDVTTMTALGRQQIATCLAKSCDAIADCITAL